MKADFSGEWILDRQASTLSSNAAAFQSGFIQIDHRDPIFNFQIRMVAGAESVEHGGEGFSDGREIAGAGALTSLRWDGDALVLTSRSQSQDAPWAISFRYELLEEGRRLRAVEQLRGAGRDQDNIWMFERR